MITADDLAAFGAPEALRAAGLRVPEVLDDGLELRGQPLTAEQVAEYQAVLDAHDPLAAAKSAWVDRVKREARVRIVQLMPEWKQRNLIARSVELVDAKAAGEASASELDELEALRSELQIIKSIRTASDVIEDEVLACTTVDDVLAIDIGGHALWP